MNQQSIPEYTGTLRGFMLKVPEIIAQCSGIRIFGRKLRSLVFSTDVSIIKNCNADAVIAVYPFTPQPVITQAVMAVSDIPVFAGIGGGLTRGTRVIDLGRHAEFQGASGVVLNGPTPNETIEALSKHIDLPIVVTVVNRTQNIGGRLKAGASILNVSAASQTPAIVREIRAEYPNVAIIATGGPTEESIRQTIEAGANAITWTPPSNGEVFKRIMAAYREDQPHP